MIQRLATEGTAQGDVVSMIVLLVKPSERPNIEPCEVLGGVRIDSPPGVGLVEGDASELRCMVRTANDPVG
ncbi:hypothetical protein LCGC14_1677840 [marine sediment metagenome]|uniref:Uncharacterized protein n=1 Tax=marine sediment metagenome TaxID=412755 RepID=A0A0F9IBW4_9ZZZZ